jgi:hypothetical protein
MIEEAISEKELAFINELEKYEGQWVAILRNGDDEVIVASGARLRDAKANAEASGFSEVVFMKVPSAGKLLIPLSSVYRCS